MLLARRAALVGIGTAGFLLPQRAQADSLFANFAFRATGAPTPRTMPDRLAEIKNVLDFGADPTGNVDSTSAIQNAVNWTAGANRGTIYFPIGSYLVSGPITFNYNGNLSICFRGEIGTLIFGSVNGYIFDRHLATPNNTRGGRIFERLSITNAHPAGGCIRIGSTLGGVVRECELSGLVGITTEDSVGVSSKNIHIQSCNFGLGAGIGGTLADANFIIIGGGGTVQNCALVGSNVAVRAYGSGLHCSGNRTERNNTAWFLGKDSGGNAVGLSGFSVESGTAEGNWTVFDLVGPCNGFFIGSHTMQGHAADNAGVIPDIQGSQYGIRIRADCAQNGVISGLNWGNFADQAGIAIENATSRANFVMDCVTSSVSGGTGVNWILPTNAYTAFLKNCNEKQLWTFSQLPTGGNLLEGDEFDITDANTTTWGANVTSGGGSSRIRVRYNGTNLTVMGK